MPRISIIIPVKDRATVLGDTLESLVAQSFEDWEALVIDDGSGDRSEAVAREWAGRDGRIRSSRRTGAGSGAPACRNEGVAAASGDCLLFFDSDDLLAPFCLEQRLALLESGGLDFVVGPAESFNSAGPSGRLVNVPDDGDALDRFCRRDVAWTTGSVLWRRDFLKRLGPWDEGLLSWQDWDFHVRALALRPRFRWGTVRDWYYRSAEADRNSIGPASFRPEHATGHLRIIGEAAERLRHHELLNQSRRRSLLGVALEVAARVAGGSREKAIAGWRQTACMIGADAGTLKLAAFYLSQYHRPWVRKVARAALRSSGRLQPMQRPRPESYRRLENCGVAAEPRPRSEAPIALPVD